MKTHTHTIANWLAVSLALMVTATATVTLTPEDHSIAPDVEYAVGFSPDTSAQESILEAINASTNQILVATHSFTSRPVAKALADAHLRGVKVFVIADELEARKKHSVASYLADRGLPVQLNGRDKIFPHNFLVVDDLTFELGNVNQSTTLASKSIESVPSRLNVKFSSDPYTHEWNRLWAVSVPLAKKY
jgi:phosphatidylserine/phosphatidylglycerophosphate/cardiolipin synthase-like enzyme